MSIRCLLCDEEDGEFSQITWSHLKSEHDITLDDYREMFPGAEMLSEEVRQTMRDAGLGNQNALGGRGSLGYVHTEEAKQLIRESMMGNQYGLGNQNALGYVHTEEAKQAIREANLGNQYALGHTYKPTEEAKQAIREANLDNQYALGHTHKLTEEVKQAIRESMVDNQNALGHVHTEEELQKMREAKIGNQYALGHTYKPTEESKHELREAMLSNWRDPRFAKMMAEAQHRKPNNCELQLQGVLDKYFPDRWKYVGDGKDVEGWIGGKNPDFMSVNGEKQVIEIFGYYWHDPILFPNRMSEEELIAHYKSYGYDCIVFWEFDVYNEEEVVNRIVKEFGLEVK